MDRIRTAERQATALPLPGHCIATALRTLCVCNCGKHVIRKQNNKMLQNNRNNNNAA